MTRRLNRIAKLKGLEMPRRSFIRCMVTPILTWSGAWSRPPRNAIYQLTTAIERCLYGKLAPGRNRMVRLAEFSGASMDIGFLLNWEAVRHATWRASHPLHHRSTQPTPRMLEVCEEWGWHALSATQFETKMGVLDLSWDGAATVRAVAEQAWQAKLLERDPRVVKARGEQAVTGRPVLSAHGVFAKQPGHSLRRINTALSSDQDGAMLKHTALNPSHQSYCKELHERYTRDGEGALNCMCGRPAPTKRHLTWVCENTQDLRGDLGPPQDTLEGEVLVRQVPWHRSPDRPGPWTTACKIHEELGDDFNIDLAASDGGAERDATGTWRGGWGICLMSGLQSRTFGGPMLGLDGTAMAAECWAAIVILCVLALRPQRQAPASEGPACPAGPAPLNREEPPQQPLLPQPSSSPPEVRTSSAVPLAIDNMNVVRSLQRLRHGSTRLGSYRASCWRTALEATALAPSEAHWIPSHGKRPEWQAPAAGDTERWREANDLADKAATEGLNEAKETARTCAQEWSAATTWANRALGLRMAVVERYYQHIGMVRHDRDLC